MNNDERKNKNRAKWIEFVGMMEPISDECLCLDPPGTPGGDYEDLDQDDPGSHSQYCPIYLFAWATAQATGEKPPG